MLGMRYGVESAFGLETRQGCDGTHFCTGTLCMVRYNENILASTERSPFSPDSKGCHLHNS